MHSGEVSMARKMRVPYDVVDRRYSTSMPGQHMDFFTDLPYFIFGNLDSQGRPWVSVITGERGFVKATSPNILDVNVDQVKWDPIVRNLEESEKHFKGGEKATQLFSGLGVDFSNRRRNKVAGEIEASSIQINNKKGDNDRVNIKVIINTKESLGNCPKYINMRALQNHKRTPTLVHDHFTLPSDFDGLPEDSKEVILQCDTIFISTRHLTNPEDVFPLNDMDVNIRGGPKGFVRVMPGGKQIIWPDYSGNRLFQSLGNIESDKKVGMVFPNFHTGDMVYVTGDAENIFGDEASSLIPSCSLVTLVTITGFVLIKGGLDLIQTNDKVAYSPYNPPVRYLRSESSLDHLARDPNSYPITISDIQKVSSNVYRYTFTISPSDDDSKSIAPLEIIPGQHALIDFSKAIPKRYSHMNEARPQRLNDDFVRSWTISSAPSSLSSTSAPNSFSCTIKLNEKGEITPFLYYYASLPANERPQLPLAHRGINGSFSIFKIPSPSPPTLELENENMLFIAGGIGVTPFLSWHSSLQLLPNLHPNIAMLFAGRNDEISLVKDFIGSPLISEIQLFQTGAQSSNTYENHAVQQRRMTKEDIAKVSNLFGRTVYICGPDVFMKDVTTWLSELNVPSSNVKQESFDF